MPSPPRFNPDPRLNRDGEVRRLRRHLLQSSLPRLQMSLLVALTAGFGLLASFLLLHGGVDAMSLRYPLAVGFAYLAFIGLLWLWMRTTWSEYIEHAADIADTVVSHRQAATSTAPDSPVANSLSALDGGSDAGSGLGNALDVIAGGDEIAVPLALLALLVALLAALAFSLFSVVWAAPALFAELLFDGVLAVGLYRRLRRADARHWLQSALRHTFWPFVLAAILAAAGGALLQHHAPQASTLSQALSAR